MHGATTKKMKLRVQTGFLRFMIAIAVVIKFVSLKTCDFLASGSRGFEANMILSHLWTNSTSEKKATCHKTTITN
jgi:hypothetical protein